MKRRAFITLLSGSTVAILRPRGARAQQDTRMRRIALLSSQSASDPGVQATWTVFFEALARLGWVEGRNLRIDLRYAEGEPDRIRAQADEVVRLAPAVIVTTSGAATGAAQRATQTIPIVFSAGGDAVANGLVQNVPRPEGNTTGFSTTEPSIAGKWLELLKEAAPATTRVALLFNPDLSPTIPSYLASIEAAAPNVSVATFRMPVRDAVEIVHAIDTFAAVPNGGLLVLPPPPTGANRNAIFRLAAQHRLPAIYSIKALAAAGGLMSYAADRLDINRRAAGYVDRILRGAKVSELPVQFPTKFELVINLKAAKAIGLTIPEAFLLRADELIE